MFITPTLANHIAVILGDSDSLRDKLAQPDFTEEFTDYIETLVVNLTAIDLKILEATEFSFVVGNRSQKLDYFSHVRHLKAQGSAYLFELANALEVQARRNKYLTESRTSYISNY
ncbi:MAG: hypothetical protein KME13_18510 [Myxacorys californica WJT36-NPBG1]|jgi:hypothetical protein|nr:hypothetical protein [Myxacorys californica WJT36-NPBG1]